MIRYFLILTLFFGPSFIVSADTETETRVRLETSMGAIVLALDADSAPVTVENFLDYVRSGFYDGTIFHRIIDEFMIQGGGFTWDLERKTPRGPIPNEADNGLKNVRGSIAMARTAEPHSATSEFFINVKNNAPLDHESKTRRGWGYAVFGRVVEGMDVVDRIRKVPTTVTGYLRDVPVDPVIIERALIESPQTTEQ